MVLTNSYSLYEMTLPLVGMENLIMGVTLSVLCLAKRYGRVHNKSGLIFLAIAMLVLTVINFTEYFVGGRTQTMHVSLAVTVFAASIELFLFFFAYASMLDKRFVTRKKIYAELILIAVFATPAIFVSKEEDSTLFTVLFTISVAYYVIKLICNFIAYRKVRCKAILEIENFHSVESSSLLAWVNRTFYVTMAIGTVSIFAPFGNFCVLMWYNLFMLAAYFFIYIEVIRNIYTFDGSMAAMDGQGKDPIPQAIQAESVVTDACVEQKCMQESIDEDSTKFMTPARLRAYEEWLSRRSYTNPDITANDIAAALNSNRTSFSAYLNNECNVSYYDWITKLRVDDIKRQLVEEPEKGISEIAVDMGITDQSYFSRMFKRVVGVTPTIYRKQNLNRPEE